ncbi:C40 family peptidase [Demequina soli]|uniref:C40 family peptidase n=1 Tax=Demequina soli TaxID=1638987 RepID=UPI000B0556ED|nr:NlpC/P60 family protein [Demequina soli]
MTAAMRRVLALAAMFALAGSIVVAGPTHRAQAEDYPGQAEIDAAKQAANDLAAGIDDLDSAIASLADARDQATANALSAGEDYVQAKDASDSAQDTLKAANKRADAAEKELAKAREALAGVAQAAYRDGGSMTQLGAVVGAETVDQVITRSEAFDRGSDQADIYVQRVKAAELVASTMRQYADDAATTAQKAADDAQAKYVEARDAQAHAEQAVAVANETRAEAVTRLAAMRGVTVALEEQRQAGLEADRQAAAQAEAERRQREAEAAAQATADPTPTRPQPTATATSTPRPTGTSSPKPSETSTPKPSATATSTPRPTPSKTADPVTTPDPVETPAPVETSTPKPTPTPTTPPVSTSWRSTAAQGRTAAAHSLTLVGREYLLGGSGPKYDCSGVTSESWSSAGLWITRSSRSQYAAVSHVPYSQIREGDLVFYATNPSDPSTIYHVAIYVGNGMVMEAVNYSKPAGVRPLYAWMTSNMMPYIGRP